ncbi:hypothetical protein LYZ37_07545 [Vibrio tubiashii]|uniref:hypothetical protein n=1 Tax=Vibrio tubiashii TaxID=29498 RepID=UPI00234E6EDF|nr:hypothetical protein [Vibrio tubiashii]WCP68571.1 hypothetical protein LYZ37_07545 [Vibrio tubiashii]
MEELDVKIVVTIIAAIVSFIGLIIAKDHKISEFRQCWINDFRADIAALMGCVSNISSKFILADKESESESIDVMKFIENAHETYDEAHRLIYKLKLMLNPKKDHDLITAIYTVESMIMSAEKMRDSKYYHNATEELYSLSHQTLKNEWTRVKKGEAVFHFTKWVLVFGIVLLLGSYVVDIYSALGS